MAAAWRRGWMRSARTTGSPRIGRASSLSQAITRSTSPEWAWGARSAPPRTRCPGCARLPRTGPQTRSRKPQACTVAALGWLAHSLASGLQLPPSRRSANPPFALWVLAHNAGLLAALLAVQRGAHALGRSSPPRLVTAVSRALLPTFLVANLLTGAANLSLDTAAVADGPAAALLCAYMGLVCAAAHVLSGRLHGGLA